MTEAKSWQASSPGWTSAREKRWRINWKKPLAAWKTATRPWKPSSASAAHDLQEPLRKIIGFSDLLEKGFREELGSRGQDLLARIRSATQRMQHLIDNLLAFSRLSERPVKLSKVDLNHVLDTVVGELDAVIRQTNANLQVDNLPTIQSDPLLMEHVFQNLISNALKFRRSDVAPHVRIYQEPPNSDHADGVRIAVEDNDIGFEMEYADRIFRPFQRLHGRSAYEGSGLGLSICKKIVEQQGGRISARSQPGVGSVFFKDLPNPAANSLL
jgi:light-regulated signal transduction histidine kinase (bacteriophytochrome)